MDIKYGLIALLLLTCVFLDLTFSETPATTRHTQRLSRLNTLPPSGPKESSKHVFKIERPRSYLRHSQRSARLKRHISAHPFSSKRLSPEKLVEIRAKKKAHPEGLRYVGSPSNFPEDIDYTREFQSYFSALRFAHGITVTTSPLLGLLSAFDAADLLYQYPSMNEDLILLQQRQYFEYELQSVSSSLANRPILVLSGGVEGQIVHSRNFNHRTIDDVNLSTGELDVLALVSREANLILIFDYDDSTPETGSRVTNSRLFLSRGFLTIGNLDQVPVYFTIGQMYLPFGKYSTAMLTTPLVRSLARILDRAALLGFYKNGFYSEAYGFKGNKIGGKCHIFKQGGVNLGYQLEHFDIGAGYVSNIADSQGMQNNGLQPIVTAFQVGNLAMANEFGGFAVTEGGNKLFNSVAALNAHMEFSIGFFQGILEYVQSIEPFDVRNLSYKNRGAKVGALHLEANFTTHIFNKVVLIGFSYGQSWQSLAFNLPKNSYTIVLSSSIWKNTMMGLEYRHDVNYGKMAQHSVTGAGFPVPLANIGGQRNIVTLQFGAYF